MTPSSSESIPQSALIFGTWARRRSAIGSAVEEVRLTFPGMNPRAPNRTRLYARADKLDEREAPQDIPICGQVKRVGNRLPFMQFVSFEPDLGPTTVTLIRDAGVFTLQSYKTALEGPVSFAPSSSYAVKVAAIGLHLTAAEQLRLALANISASYAVKAGTNFPDIDVTTIVASTVIGRLSENDFAELKQRFPAMKSSDLRRFF
jgi:hypothetical protein